MSIRNAASTSSRAKILSGIFDYNAPYALGGWVQLTVDRNSPSTLFCVVKNNAGSGNDTGDYVWTESDGTSMRAACYNNGASSLVTGTNWTAGTWYFVMLVRESATVLRMYLNGVLDATVTRDVTSRAAATQLALTVFVGPTSSHTAPLNGRISNLYAYSRALDPIEIQSQMYMRRPVSWDNLWGWWNFWTADDQRFVDQSGNGRNFTLDGTLAYEDDPGGWATGGYSSIKYFSREPATVDVSVSLDKLLGAGALIGGAQAKSTVPALTKHLFVAGAGGAQAGTLVPALTKHLFVTGNGKATSAAPVALNRIMAINTPGRSTVPVTVTVGKRLFATATAQRAGLAALTLGRINLITAGRTASLTRSVALSRIALISSGRSATKPGTVALNRVNRITTAKTISAFSSLTITKVMMYATAAARLAAASVAINRVALATASASAAAGGYTVLSRVNRVTVSRLAAQMAALTLARSGIVTVTRKSGLSGALSLSRSAGIAALALQAQSAAISLAQSRTLSASAAANVRAAITLQISRFANTNRQAAAQSVIAISRINRISGTARQALLATVALSRVNQLINTPGRYVYADVGLTVQLHAQADRKITIASATSLARSSQIAILTKLFVDQEILLPALYALSTGADVIDLESSVPLERMLIVQVEERLGIALPDDRFFVVPEER